MVEKVGAGDSSPERKTVLANIQQETKARGYGSFPYVLSKRTKLDTHNSLQTLILI